MPKGRTEKIDEEDILRAAKGIEDPCFASREIAELLGVSTQTVRNKINALVDDNVIGTKKIGNAHAYWIIGY
jgi:transcription initiation factor IIE alpha subunit